MRGIENQIDRRRAKREDLSPTLRIAHERARSVLKDPALVIQETDFAETYSAEQIEKDIAFVKNQKAKWDAERSEQERNSKKIAEILEAIIMTEGELSEWLGNATTMKTADYDDFKNKVDLISEWHSPEDGSRLLALGVDVTFGTTKLAEKFEELKREIDSDMLTSIKYFRDERGDFMGRRNNVPRVVIGISQEVIEELAARWNAKDKKSLGEHPIQHVLLKEIQVQLQAMRDYALRTGKAHLATAYQPAIAIIGKLIAAKGSGAYRPLADDKIFTSILDLTKKTFEK